MTADVATDTPPPGKRRSSLGERAVSGTLWTVIRYAIEYVLRLGGNLVMTRLLFPEAFGLMAIVNAFMTGLQMFSDVGIGQSVVQNPRGDAPVFLRTAWTFQVLRGALLWVIAAAFAGVVAHVYEQVELGVLIRVAGLTVLIGGFNSIALARYKRHIKLKQIVINEVGGRVVAMVVMMTWAWLAPSVWALVAGGLAGAIAKLIFSHTLLGGPSLRFGWDKESVDQLLGFGKWVFVSTVLAFLAGQADRLIFGRLVPVATLGVYSIAQLFAGIPTQLVWTIGNLVLFPTFSRRASSAALLDSTYRRVQRPVYILGSLPVACLAAGGPALIEVLYDPRYADAGWMLQPLAFGTWVQILQTVSGAALLACGDPRRLAFGNGLKFAAMLVLVPLGFIYFGTLGGITGLAVAEVFRYATLAYGLRHHQLPGPGSDLRHSGLVVAATAVGLATNAAIGDALASWLRLVCTVLAVLLVWTPVAFVVLRPEFAELTAMARERLSRR